MFSNFMLLFGRNGKHENSLLGRKRITRMYLSKLRKRNGFKIIQKINGTKTNGIWDKILKKKKEYKTKSCSKIQKLTVDMMMTCLSWPWNSSTDPILINAIPSLSINSLIFSTCVITWNLIENTQFSDETFISI